MKLILVMLIVFQSALALAFTDEEQMIYEDLLENGLDPVLVASTLLWRGENQSLIPNDELIIIVDMKSHSSKERFFIYDISTRMLDTFTVTHGVNSDPNKDGYADVFSNTVDSLKSSLGAYTTAETYYSNKFKSRALKLDGHSPGLNTNVRSRYIVLHQAPYADESMIEEIGRLGMSEGCLVLDPDVTQTVIDIILGGTYIFVGYGGDYNRYLTPSQRDRYKYKFRELNII